MLSIKSVASATTGRWAEVLITMGIKRLVDTDLWTDEKVEEFTPEEKYFWVYLLTNPYTKQLGIYHITKKQMAFQLGYDVDTVSKLLDRFENKHQLIKYIDNEIAIFNFLKRSILKGGKPVEDCLKADLKNVKHKELIEAVFDHLQNENLNETVMKVISNYKNDIHNDNDIYSIVNVSSTIRNDGTVPKYDPSRNKVMGKDEEEELLQLMKGKK